MTRGDEFAGIGLEESQLESLLKMQYQARKTSYRLHYPDQEHRIVMEGSRPIGQLIVAEQTSNVILVDIALLPDKQNQGIGTLLLRQLQTDAGEHGKSIALHVLQSSPAFRLYDRLGFRLVQEQPPYHGMVWNDKM